MKLHEIQHLNEQLNFYDSENAITKWLETYTRDFNKYTMYTIDGSVVNSKYDVYFRRGYIGQLRVKFGTVAAFVLWEDSGVTSTAGFPHSITDGNFAAERAFSKEVTSLVGCPTSIEYSYNVTNNFLTSLKGAPHRVPGNFSIGGNNSLATLEHGPFHVGGDYNAFDLSIGDLTGIARHIGGQLDIQDTEVTSLCGISDKMDHLYSIMIGHNQITAGGIGLILIEGFRHIITTGGLQKWANIINEYAGRPDEIFECQAELIEAGYPEHAQL